MTDAAARTSSRLTGVDVARCLALVGMMSVHILPSATTAGTTSLAYLLASGRAAALFALLAGVGLALASGGEHPRRGRAGTGFSVGLGVRALLIGAVGLLLVDLDPPVAVILTYYALLFLIAVPLLRLRAPVLIALAVVWALVSPVLSHLLRRAGDLSGPGEQPGLIALADPAGLLTTLTLTGYYPVLQWTTYLLAGLAVGRLALRSSQTALRLLGAGLMLGAAGKLVSFLLLHGAGGYERLLASVPPGSRIESLGLDAALERSFYGTTPTTSWWWLAVSTPHSSTTLDLVHTVGTSLAVLGTSLLVVPWLQRHARWVVFPFAAAGSMTLSVYSAHVLALALEWGPAREVILFAAHVVVALIAATLWRAAFRRGPLEAVAAAASGTATRAVVGQPSASGQGSG